MAQKDNVGSDFFSFPALAYKIRPKYIFSRDMFCKGHFELIFHSVSKGIKTCNLGLWEIEIYFDQ